MQSEGQPTAQCPHRSRFAGSMKRPATFSHPDYTVGPGVAPDPGEFRRTALPWDDRLSGPLRPEPSDFPSRALPPIGNWEVPFPHPAPKVLIIQISTTLAREGIRSQAVWWAGPGADGFRPLSPRDNKANRECGLSSSFSIFHHFFCLHLGLAASFNPASGRDTLVFHLCDGGLRSLKPCRPFPVRRNSE